MASFSFLQDSSCADNISIVPETVSEALEKLRTNKQDGSQLSYNHVLLAAPVIGVGNNSFWGRAELVGAAPLGAYGGMPAQEIFEFYTL